MAAAFRRLGAAVMSRLVLVVLVLMVFALFAVLAVRQPATMREQEGLERSVTNL